MASRSRNRISTVAPPFATMTSAARPPVSNALCSPTKSPRLKVCTGALSWMASAFPSTISATNDDGSPFLHRASPSFSTRTGASVSMYSRSCWVRPRQ